jgi:capsid protein
MSFDGEKNFGELGDAKNYIPNYEVLRARSWEAFISNDLAMIALSRLSFWVISTGLRLDAQPDTDVLELEGISTDRQKFSNSIEAYWRIWSRTPSMCHKSGSMSFAEIQTRVFMNAWIGGDCLVILRVEKGNPTVQIIDGCHIQSPGAYDPLVRNGVEYNELGKIVAYHIRKDNYEFDRIPAVNETYGLVQAFLVKGLRYKLDDSRGLPLLSAVLEKMAQIDRYSVATLGSAEERRKIPYVIEHDQHSTGENPLTKNFVYAQNPDMPFDLPIDSQGEVMANKMAVTTNKSVFNMPIGAKAKALESDGELYYRDFYTINADFLFATLSLPPNVALQKYDSNFSASRAALKDWENTLAVYRAQFSNDFLQHVYNWFLHTFILRNKIQAIGYLSGDSIVRAAYRCAKFTGVNVPHIDPVKEVEAARMKLGELGASIPLITVEDAVQALGGSDADAIMEQFSQEKKYSEELGLKPEPPAPPAPANPRPNPGA